MEQYIIVRRRLNKKKVVWAIFIVLVIIFCIVFSIVKSKNKKISNDENIEIIQQIEENLNNEQQAIEENIENIEETEEQNIIEEPKVEHRIPYVSEEAKQKAKDVYSSDYKRVFLTFDDRSIK